MEINTNSWHVRFYRSAYQETLSEMPKSFCLYFWKLVWALILLPLSFPAHIANMFKLELSQHCGTVVSVFALALGASFASPSPEPGSQWLTTNIAAIYGLGLVVMIAVISALTGIFQLYYFFHTRIENIRRKKSYSESSKSKKPNLIVTAWRSFKEKSCPIIEWKENKS